MTPAELKAASFNELMAEADRLMAESRRLQDKDWSLPCTCGTMKGEHSDDMHCPNLGEGSLWLNRTFRSQVEQEAIDRNNEVVMKRLDAHFEWRGGCFEEN